MQRRRLIRFVVAALGAAGACLFGRPLIAASPASTGPPACGMMGGMMGGHGMDEMMSPGNMMGPMRTGMQLFARHNEIRRRVTELPSSRKSPLPR